MNQQGGDSTAGMQALPVGKIIEVKVLRKDNQEIVQPSYFVNECRKN